MSIDIWSNSSEVVVNMANGNARSIFGVLGIEWDYCGSIAAIDLWARVEMALAVNTGAEYTRPTVEIGGVGTGMVRFIECGIDEDYITHRLEAIKELCSTTVVGDEIHWG